MHYPYHGVIGAGVLWLRASRALDRGSSNKAVSSLRTLRMCASRPFEKFELATAALFDVGVFLAVVGAVMLSLESFSRLARRAHVKDSDNPMDVDPSRLVDEQNLPEGGV